VMATSSMSLAARPTFAAARAICSRTRSRFSETEFIVEAAAAADAYYFSSSVLGTSTVTTTAFIVLELCASIFAAEIPSPKVRQW